MRDYLCISTTFLDRRFHGRGDGGEPEWPPSPLRLMQAIVAANADQIGADGPLDHALGWLERQPPPLIIAPRHAVGAAYRLSVPNNAMDLVGKAWARENYFGSGDASPATHRTMKTVRPIHICGGDTVHYLWAINGRATPEALSSLCRAAGRLVALGWGIDLVVARAEKLSTQHLGSLAGERWSPGPSAGLTALRVPRDGTLEALRERHGEFIRRIGEDGFSPVAPITRFRVVGYRRPIDPVLRAHAVFELRHEDGSYCQYPQRKLIHIAGMVRHLAKRAMEISPPAGVDAGWVERYVVGHRDKNAGEHRQLSYLPLPSIGHRHADQLVRRIMIAAPVGDDDWLEHVARRLAGCSLEPDPKRGADFKQGGRPTLVRVHADNVARGYLLPANRWASVTPVILPGHDDRKPAKTRKLIEASLAHSGVQPTCEFEWSAISRFPKSFPAYRQKRPAGYFRPDHLPSETAVHLTLTFGDDLEVPGPLVVGAGRHCGLGLFARAPDS